MAVTPKREQIINDPLSEQKTKAFNTTSQNSKAIFLQQASALSDDSSLCDLRNSIYQARGRSETDDDVFS
jgi:hypothetical protein